MNINITILPDGKIVKNEIILKYNKSYKNLCDFLIKNKININHACEQNGVCSTCHVLITKGFNKINNKSNIEEDLLDSLPLSNSSSRLSCQVKEIKDDITIKIV